MKLRRKPAAAQPPPAKKPAAAQPPPAKRPAVPAKKPSAKKVVEKAIGTGGGGNKAFRLIRKYPVGAAAALAGLL